MSTATMSYGVRARERMPFAWDTVTLGLVAALLLVGLVMVTSASITIAARDMSDPFYFLERQFIFTVAGLIFAWVMTRVPAELWDKYSLALLLLALLLLTLVLIPGLGARVNGVLGTGAPIQGLRADWVDDSVEGNATRKLNTAADTSSAT